MRADFQECIQRRQDTVGRIKAIFINNLNVNLHPDEIDADAALFGTGLELDSIDAVEIAVAVEAAFGVKLRTIASRGSFRTINTIADLILEARENDAPAGTALS